MGRKSSSDPDAAQLSLGIDQGKTSVYTLTDGATLTHISEFLSLTERQTLLRESKRYRWERQPVRGVQTLRSNAWFAENRKCTYVYSGQSWKAYALTVAQQKVRDRLMALLDERMDSILATYYPHGGAGVQYHADDELIFGKNPTIASLSIGATRVFQVVKKSRADQGQADLELTLRDGDLVLMQGTFQEHYLHAVKKTSKDVGARLNLSYRRIQVP